MARPGVASTASLRPWDAGGRDEVFSMITDEQFEQTATLFPAVRGADPQMIREFRQAVSASRLREGDILLMEGDRPRGVPLVLSGVVRVYRTSKAGREITLYRFAAGESCVLSANSVLSRQPFPANAAVESEGEVVSIPADVFRDWVGRHEEWREFFFGLVSRRLSSVLGLLDEVVFGRLDSRVAAHLHERGRLHNPISVTHHEIATELGSSREVISRILEGFAAAREVRLTRGEIEVLDFSALEARAEG